MTTPEKTAGSAVATLATALLGFFVVTLDAVVVNIALPDIRTGLGGGIAGLQWVVDGYTLMFAAALLSAGSLADRIGAKKAFGLGIAGFTLASPACGPAPQLGVLVACRFAQGLAAAVVMPSSMALIAQTYPDPVRRARAVAMWAMGGAAASSAGPLLGGVLTTVSWRWIFLINLPAGAVALLLLRRVGRSDRHRVPFDAAGQLVGALAMAALVFGAIEAGQDGFGRPAVLTAFGIAVLALAAFVLLEARIAHPMLPLELFRSRTVVAAVVIGFAFMIGYYGMPFVLSLVLQDRGLSSPATGVVFLPMMPAGLVLTPDRAPRGRANRRPARGRDRPGADDGRRRGPRAPPRHRTHVSDRRTDDSRRAGRSHGDPAGDRGPARRGPRAPGRDRERGVQHQPPARRRTGRRSLRRPAGRTSGFNARHAGQPPTGRRRRRRGRLHRDRGPGHPPLEQDQRKGTTMTDNPQPSGAEKMFGDFAPALVHFTDDVLFGEVWKRTDLTPKERSLVTVAALTTNGNTEQLVYHLGLAKENGNTEAELIEAITHLAFYAGWPQAMAAMAVAKKVFRN
ncbi:MFS transporter [Amycolatopsis sp. NPDC051371]|uniref:MFS transporter n=1 Tax=Amycolatopsis sp. NPDC051371 TaxID=3155800 RepID=UPI0034419399